MNSTPLSNCCHAPVSVSEAKEARPICLHCGYVCTIATPPPTKESGTPIPGSLEDEANKAITCLYIAVDASIADDVKQRVGAFVCQLKRERDDALAEVEWLKKELADTELKCGRLIKEQVRTIELRDKQVSDLCVALEDIENDKAEVGIQVTATQALASVKGGV